MTEFIDQEAKNRGEDHRRKHDERRVSAPLGCGQAKFHLEEARGVLGKRKDGRVEGHTEEADDPKSPVQFPDILNYNLFFCPKLQLPVDISIQ